MGFFSGYKQGGAWGVLAGLGRLTAPGSNAASKDAKRVVKAFVNGEPAQGACKGPKGARTCEITSTSSELRVGNYTLAKRPASADSSYVSVCVPDRAKMITLKSGKQVEAQDSKDVRAASGALLREVGSGLGVRTDAAGIRRLVGARGRRAVEVPNQCMVVKLSKKQAMYAQAGREAAGEAVTTYTTPFPTQTQLNTIRKVQAKAKKMLALEKAKAARAAATAKRQAQAAEKKAAAEAKKASKAAAAAEKKAASDAQKAAAEAAKAAAEAQKAAAAEAAKAATEAKKAAAEAKPKKPKAAKKGGKKGSKK